jgi:archaemetzincin
MKPIRIVPIGAVDRPLLDSVTFALMDAFQVPCSVSPAAIDPNFALHPERGQVHSSMLIEELAALGWPVRTLGVTAADLYIPILTFVFGEAHLDGHCAVVSYRRLTQEFYGLPPDPVMTAQRLMKEAVHEVGHTYGLTHCDDYECVMAAAHSVEWLDLRGDTFCDDCRGRIEG